MLPTSVTKATSVLLPEVEAAASEVASVVVLVAVLAEGPPQAARESASHYKSEKLFHGFDLLRLFSVAQQGGSLPLCFQYTAFALLIQ
jgi:hypothetical protein